MFFVGIISWWYGNGWRERLNVLSRRLSTTLDFFSITLLLKTLFAPFRQISAGSSSGSLSTMARAFVDRTISRFIGAFLRTSMILIGLIIILLQGAINILVILIWPIIPILPVIGLILTIIGWVPSWR